MLFDHILIVKMGELWCNEILQLGFSDKFFSMWDYYLIYSLAGFKCCTLGNLQVLMFSITHFEQLFPYCAIVASTYKTSPYCFFFALGLII